MSFFRNLFAGFKPPVINVYVDNNSSKSFERGVEVATVPTRTWRQYRPSTREQKEHDEKTGLARMTERQYLDELYYAALHLVLDGVGPHTCAKYLKVLTTPFEEFYHGKIGHTLTLDDLSDAQYMRLARGVIVAAYGHQPERFKGHAYSSTGKITVRYVLVLALLGVHREMRPCEIERHLKELAQLRQTVRSTCTGRRSTRGSRAE